VEAGAASARLSQAERLVSSHRIGQVSPVRSLTPLEAAVGVAVVGSVMAAAVPAFVRNVHASKLVEPIDGLSRIATRATALSAGRPVESAYPASAPLTPAEVPAGVRVTDPPGTWEHPTWRLLDFELSVPHSFSFAFESGGSAEVAVFRAVARGDLDGDGSLSELSVSGETRAGGEPRVFPMDMYREVE
jgi:hypothetical protein